MAVPVYERRENIAPLPGAKVNAAGGADAYGAGVGGAISNFAETSMKLLNDFEDTETLEAYNNFKRDVSLYHTAPDKGVLLKQGKDANGLYQSADLWMNNRAEEYARKMKNPRMVNNFRRLAGQTILSQGEQDSKYEAEQLKKYRLSEAEAAVEMAVNDAAANWQDDAAVAAAEQRGIEALAVGYRGMGDEAWKSGLADLRSKIAVAQLAPMIENDPRQAKTWFEGNKDRIIGINRAKIQGIIQDEIDKRERKETSEKEDLERASIVERIWETYNIDEAAGTDAIYNDDSLSFEQKVKITGLYQARVSDQRRFDEQEIKTWYEATRNEVANAGSMEAALAKIEYSRADGWERTQLEGIAAQLYKPETFKEDIQHWNQAYQEVTSGLFATAEDFIYRWNGILSQDSMKSFLKLFYNSDGGGGAKSARYIGDSIDKMMKLSMESLNIYEGTIQAQRFSTLVTEEIWARQREKGRPLSPEEMGGVIMEYSKKFITVEGGFFTSEQSIPNYERKIAESLGFALGTDGQLYRDGPDGVETYDPRKYYPSPPAAAVRPSQQGQQGARLPGGIQVSMPEVRSSGVPGPRRMPDGTEIGLRRQKKQNVSSSAPSASTQEFIDEIKTGVLNVADEIDVLPSVLFAQAILESGHGKSRIGNNIFGVKAGSNWTGATRTAKTAAGNATFRDYGSVEDSIRDLGKVLSGKRYSAAIGETDYATAAQAIQDGGYAGKERDYASKLIKIIERYKLYEYDGV
jgi:hypothetical protein